MDNLKRSGSLFGDIVGAIVLIAICCVFAWMVLSSVVKNHSVIADGYSESYEMAFEPTKYDLLDDSLAKLERNLNSFKRMVQQQKTNLSESEGLKLSSLSIYSYTDSVRRNKQTFIGLLDFGLNQNSFDYENATRYYFKDGVSHLRIPKLTKINKHYYKLRYEDKKVAYRYDENSNAILIPLNKGQELNAKIFGYTLGGIAAFIFVFGIVLIFRFLIGISRNRIFETINIRRLFWISVCCFTTVLIPYVVSGVLYLLYVKNLSGEVIYTKKMAAGECYIVMLGLLFIALYVAFKKGLKLKQENDLTI